MSSTQYNRKKNFKREETVFTGTDYEKTFIIPGRFQDRRKAEKEKNEYVQKIKKILRQEYSPNSTKVTKSTYSELLIPVKKDKKNTLFVRESKIYADKYLHYFEGSIKRLEKYVNYYKSQINNIHFLEFTIHDFNVMLKSNLINV